MFAFLNERVLSAIYLNNQRMAYFRKEGRRGGHGNGGGFKGRDGGRRMMHRATCSDCGNSCEVPFKPTNTKPIFCSSCFEHQGEPRSKSFGRKSDRFNNMDRELFTTTCGSCGDSCEVPFKPTNGKTVYCSSCFGKNKSNDRAGGNSNQMAEINEKLDRILQLLGANKPQDSYKPKKKKNKLFL